MGPRQEDGMESQIKALREVIERATDVEAKLTRAQAEINTG
jgi:hypothetical protein